MPYPRYTCHKQVAAFKIASIGYDKMRDGVTLTPVEPFLPPAQVSAEYMRKHNPQAGGYYVTYEDGYESFSPAAAFEAGYTKC